MRSVLITGSSSGFGRGMVTAFLKDGWDVIATLRDADRRRGLFAAEAGSRLRVETLDVTSAADRERLSRSLERLDCLVNNAGYGILGAFENTSEEEFRRQMEVNFFGTVLMTRAFLPTLRRARGRIINVSSIFGYAGFPLTSAYCASKFAVEGFSESLYYELKPHGVQVCLVEPGGHTTKMGENIVWSGGAESAYGLQTENYHKLKARLAAIPGRNPRKVVDAVLALAKARTMPLRRIVGKDAVSVHLAKKLLPQRLSTGFFTAVYDRVFLKGS